MSTTTLTQGNTSLFMTAAERAERILAVMRSYPANPTVDDHIAYAHALADLGVHVAVIHVFGEKLPFDLRTEAQKEADTAAGRTKKGWYLSTLDKSRLTDYITKAVQITGGLPNIGAHLGPSRLVAVDCDNEGDGNEWAYAASLRGEPQTTTVLTPGKIDAKTGQWVHRDGTHIYYTISDHVDPSTLREITEPNVPEHEPRGGWAVKVGDGLGVVFPPSVRHEGQYKLYSRAEIIETPTTLLAMLAKPAPRIRDYDDDDEDVVEFRESVDDAMNDVTWEQILSPYAYHDGYEVCGCDIWTRHGGSRKSFVAHTDCSTLGGRTCLVVHSDNVHNHSIFVEMAKGRGGKSFSKWEALAVLHFDGDMGAVAREYGFSRPSNRTFDWTSVFADDDGVPTFGMSGGTAAAVPTPDPTRCPHGGNPDACVPCIDRQIAEIKAGGVK